MKNETSTTELLSSVLLNFNPPRRHLSIFWQLSIINSATVATCFFKWQKLLWTSCRYIYIPSGLHSGVQHEFTKVTKSCRSLSVWRRWDGFAGYRRCRAPTGEQESGSTATVRLWHRGTQAEENCTIYILEFALFLFRFPFFKKKKQRMSAVEKT